MTNTQPDDRALEFVNQYLDFIEGQSAEPDAAELPAHVRAQAFQILRALDEFAPEHPSMRPTPDDPIARRFGFGRPEDVVTLSTAALKDAAQEQGLRMSDLARRLTDAGDPTTNSDLLSMMSNVTAAVSRARAARLAAILKSSIPDLEAIGTAGGGELSLEAFLVLDEARRVIEAFAEEHRMNTVEVSTRAQESLAMTAFRNQTETSWIEALHAVLDRIARERP